MSNFEKYGALVATGIVGLAIGIDFTVVSTILPVIQRELSASMAQLQWLIAGFSLLFCTCMVAAGKLGDNFGHRKLMYFAAVGFGTASFFAGLSSSPHELIVWRLVQGLFAAAVFPCSMGIIARCFPQEQQGRAIGSFTAIVGIGLAVGPVFGGLITSMLSWRWVFLFNIPTVIVSLICCVLWVKADQEHSRQPIDWAGMFTLMASLALLIFGITQGPINGWTSSLIISTLVLGVVGLALFSMIEKRTSAPLIPLKLVANSNFLLGLCLNISAVGFSYIVLFSLSIYLHLILGMNSSSVGLIMFPMTALTFVMPYIAGHCLDRYGPKGVSLVIMLCALLAFFIFSQFTTHTTTTLIIVGSVIFGMAWGLANGSANPIALSNLPAEQVSVTAGAQMTVLNIFGILSVSVGGAIINHSMLSQVQQFISQTGTKLSLSEINVLIQKALSGGLVATQHHDLAVILQESFLNGFKSNALFFALLVFVMFLGVIKLLRHKTSKLQENSA